MARDDYDKIVCVILKYLYARLRGKTDELLQGAENGVG